MSLNSSSTEEISVLCAGTTSRRKLPLNLKQSDVGLFNDELERVIPPTRLLRFKNVNISPEGILFRQATMLPESFAFPHNREIWKRRTVVKFFLNNYFVRRHRRVDEPAIWVTDDWSAGYFHWLGDVLPRLLTVKDQLKNLTLLLPAGYEDLEFVTATLELFAIGRVEYVGADEVVTCKDLLLPTQTAPSGHYNEGLIREVRRMLIERFAKTPEPTDRIYISRGAARKRKVANELEVIELLEEFGFKIMRAEELSFAQQVSAAAAAKHLVSNHGAGLTNILFMPAGSSVLELRNQRDNINNCYFTLASALDLKYFYQNCESTQEDEDPHSADLIVDVAALRSNLELMLSS